MSRQSIGLSGTRDKWAPALLAAAVFLFCVPAFFKPFSYGPLDPHYRAKALMGLFHWEQARHILLEFGEIAWRSPFVGGGYPAIKNPLDPSLSPLLLPVLLFGAAAGLKLLIMLSTWTGAWGVYLLARRFLKFHPNAALFSALVFVFSAWLPSQALEGRLNIYLPFFPMVLYLLLTSAGHPRRIVAAGGITGALAISGGPFMPSFFYMLLVVPAFWSISQYTRPDNRLLKSSLLPRHGWRGENQEPRFLIFGLKKSRDGLFEHPDKSSLPLALGALALLLAASAPIAFFDTLPASIRLLIAGALVLYLFEFRRPAKLLWAYLPVFLGTLALFAIAAGVAYGRINATGSLSAQIDSLKPPQDQLFAFDEKPPPGRDRFYKSATSFANALMRPAPMPPFKNERDAHAAPGEGARLGLTIVPLLGFFLGVAAYRRRFLPFLLSLLVATLVCFGSHFPLDFYKALIEGIPLIGGMESPYRHFSFFILFFIALLSGGGLNWIDDRLRTPWMRRVAAGGFFLSLALPFFSNSPLYAHAFAAPMPEQKKNAAFHQLQSAPAKVLREEGFVLEAIALEIFPGDEEWRRKQRRDRSPRPGLFPVFNLRRGLGTIDWKGSFPLPEAALPRQFVLPDNRLVPNPKYRGEATFYEERNRVLSLEVTANTISVKVLVRDGGLLTVNQNYDADFRVRPGELVEYQGRLAASLSTPGEYTVRFVYRPQKLIRRWLMSLFFLLGLAAFCLAPSQISRKWIRAAAAAATKRLQNISRLPGRRPRQK